MSPLNSWAVYRLQHSPDEPQLWIGQGKSWAAIRVAGSGSMKYPCPDVLAGNAIRRLAIECKSVGDTKKYFTKQEIDALAKFSLIFGAEAWVGVRFDNKKWFFVNLEDLKENDSSFVLTFANAQQKGLVFEELLGVF